jgi:hypothetical protein
MNHISCSRECKRVWGNEPSHSQVNSHCESWNPKWTFNFLESDCSNQNPMDWVILYIIGKLLERRCPKWVCMNHLDIWNTSYGQKKGQKSNWQFDSQPLKVRNCPNFLKCKWQAIYRWKALDNGYNFSLDLITIKGLHTKLWAPKVVGVLGVEIMGLPSDSHLGVLGQNAIWMWASWRGTKYTIRGKVVASPKSGPWWILWVRVYPWLVLAPKVLKLCIN